MPPARRTLTKQRARSAPDKALRRDNLHAAAAGLLATTPYEQLSLQAVARRAGMSKASAYTYFSTKESLFLSLLSARLCAWRDALCERMPRRRSKPATVARVIAETIDADPVLRDLLARVHSQLEVNVPDEEIIAFKTFLAGLIGECAAAVQRALPALAPARAEHLFLLVHSLVIGLGMACAEVPNVSRALAQAPALEAAFDIDFVTELTLVVELILQGWLTD